MTTSASAMITMLNRLGSKSRHWNLSLIENFLGPSNYAEVYFNCPFEVCDKRHKGSKSTVEKSFLMSRTGFVPPHPQSTSPA